MTSFSPAGRFRRTRRRVGSAATLAVVGLTLVVSAVPVAAATPTPFNTNLVKNPSFEAGSATGGYRPIAVPSWTTSGNMTVVKYGAPNGFPTLAESAQISGGKKFFTSGTPANGDPSCPNPAMQRIPIRGRASAIDAGRVEASFSVYMGTYGSQPDKAVAVVNNYDSAGHLLNNLTRISISHTNSEMYGLGGRAVLPAGTRSLRIFLAAADTQGYCDAYFDRVSLTLKLL